MQIEGSYCSVQKAALSSGTRGFHLVLQQKDIGLGCLLQALGFTEGYQQKDIKFYCLLQDLDSCDMNELLQLPFNGFQFNENFCMEQCISCASNVLSLLYCFSKEIKCPWRDLFIYLFQCKTSFFSRLVSMATCLIWLFSHAVKAIQFASWVHIYSFPSSIVSFHMQLISFPYAEYMCCTQP